MLAVGGPRDAAYEPSPWEDVFAAEPLRAAGDYEAYAAALASALEKRPDHPPTLYNLACAEALAGRADDALPHLERALELRPEMADWAREDEDFAVAARPRRLAAVGARLSRPYDDGVTR